MAFGKKPLTREEVATLHAQAQAERAKRAACPAPRVPALDTQIREELSFLEAEYGKDSRLMNLATTFAIIDAHRADRVDGEVYIEATGLFDQLDETGNVTDSCFVAWAKEVTAPGPKGRPSDADRSTIAALSAFELDLALRLTNGRVRAKSEGAPDRYGAILEDAAKKSLKRSERSGARFARDHASIIADWLREPETLSVDYRPGGNLRAPRAFMRKRFEFRLDRERRVVGGVREVTPAWIRRQRRDGRLGKGMPLTLASVDNAQTLAHKKMTHAPPDGYLISSTLAPRLGDRQEAGSLALELKRLGNRHPDFQSVAQRLVNLDRWDDTIEWLDAPSSPPLPPWAVHPKVGVSPRSVDDLVHAYEELRGTSFERRGRSALIPESEEEAIVAFANRRALTRRR